MRPKALRTLPLTGLWLAAALLPLSPPAIVAQAPPPQQPIQFDPSDIFFQGWLAARNAEELEAEGDFTGALERLQHAARLFETVRQVHPGYRPEMVGGRIEITAEALEAVLPKAEEQRRRERGVIAELEGGLRMGADQEAPDEAEQRALNILEMDPIVKRRLEDAEREVARLRQELQASGPGSPPGARDAARLRENERQREALAARLRAAEAEAANLRGRLSAAPVEEELRGLNDRIRDLEQEGAAMARALQQSAERHTESLANARRIQAELEAMTQHAADLERDLEVERRISNEVVAGQRRQIEDLTRQLGESNETIGRLEHELAESREANAVLRDERDRLLAEREQLRAILRLTEDGRIEELIEQNVGLARNLREAEERLDLLSRDGNATKDALIQARRDLAIAREEINHMQREKIAQERRVRELESRLQREDGLLARGVGALSPDEADSLRAIIQRQLRAQERQRQARDVLVEAARELGAQDATIARAIQLFDAQEFQLSSEEHALIADRRVDGEFIAPFARERGLVGRAEVELNRELESYDRAATRAFASGRLSPARELFQMMVEANPGHIPALCKLGVVQLRLEEPETAANSFQRATELDPENPFAHRMLGLARMMGGDLPGALEPLERSVELAPENAHGHSLLGTIAYIGERFREAEDHFQAAIAADPMPSEPYYNLARISARMNRANDARQYYDQALERGAEPDPALERQILGAS